jgi:Flp pilus assembly pilin Flp
MAISKPRHVLLALRHHLSLLVGDEGQTLSEYALLLALIAVVVSVAVLTFGGHLGDYWTYISTQLPF